MRAGIRADVYAGEILPAAVDVSGIRATLCAWFDGPLETVHERLSLEAYLSRLAHARAEVGTLDPRALWPGQTAGMVFDRVRVRGLLHEGHLHPGADAAYACHRDIWYANPPSQINVWIAVTEAEESQTMRFWPRWFARPVENSSHQFDYDAFVAGVGFQSVRPGNGAVYPSCVPPSGGEGFASRAGQGRIFSASHLHQSRNNETGRTRFSVELRAVHRADHVKKLGAPEVDNASTGSALVDYR